MKRVMLLSFLACLVLFASGCSSGAAVYGRYPGSTGIEYVGAYQPYAADLYYANVCCMLQGMLYCENPAQVQACFDYGGTRALPGTIASCCEFGGRVVDYYSYADCIKRGGRPVSCW